MDQQPQVNTGADVGSVASSISPFAADIARSQANQEKVQKFTDEKIKQVEDLPIPQPPKMLESPKPENYSTPPIQTFGSAAMWLATFGSLLTKHPLQSALDSGAAVMNAANKKDAYAFNQAMDKFKLDVENSKLAADYQIKLYDAMKGKPEEEQRMMLLASNDGPGKMMFDAKMFQIHEKAARRNAEKITDADTKNKELKRRIDSGEDPTEAFNEIYQSSAERKERDKLTSATNFSRKIDEANTMIQDAIDKGYITGGILGTAEMKGQELLGNIDEKDRDSTLSLIQSKLAAIRNDYISMNKSGGRLKAAQDRVNEIIPGKGALEQGGTIIDSLTQLRDDTITDAGGKIPAKKGESFDSPLPMPKNMRFEKKLYYDTPNGIGQYKGNGEFE